MFSIQCMPPNTCVFQRIPINESTPNVDLFDASHSLAARSPPPPAYSRRIHIAWPYAIQSTPYNDGIQWTLVQRKPKV